MSILSTRPPASIIAALLLTLIAPVAAADDEAQAKKQPAKCTNAWLSDKARECSLPLWEVGAGVAGAVTPDYPSASGSTARALPIPLFIYRGDFLRIGDGNVASGRFFRNDRLEFDVSLSGSFDAESDDVGARAGMPDLGFGFELGPELEITLSDPDDYDQRLKLELPVRAAFSLDDGTLNDRGYVFSPQLEYERSFGDSRYEWSVSVTPTWATQSLHRYFYEVAPEFATAARPAYEAKGGYLQTSFGVGLQRRTRSSFMAVGLSYRSLHGASNEDSPLFRSTDDVSFAAIMIFKLFESKKLVTN